MINVAVVGCGYWGPNLVRNFIANHRCCLKGCCDLKRVQLKAVNKVYPGLILTTDIDDILKNKMIDAVAIATPLATHYDLARQALLAGKHVLVEKPFVSSLAQADELADLARLKKRILMVGQTYLYHPAVIRIKRMIEQSQLGKLHYLNSTRVHFGHVRPNESVFWDLASHDLATAFFWLEKYHYRVSCSGRDGLRRGFVDTADINFEFLDNGPLVNIFVSWLAPIKMRTMIITGSKKMIFFNDTRGSEKIKVYDQRAVRTEVKNSHRFHCQPGDVFSPNLDATEPLALEIDDFLTCISTGRIPVSNAGFNRHVIKALEAMDQALASGRKVTVKE